MQNWTIDEDKEFVFMLGAYLVQVVTVECFLESIFNELEKNALKQEGFNKKMLGKKIEELRKRISGRDIFERLERLNELRCRIAHNAPEYDPVRKEIRIKQKILKKEELELELAESKNLLSDLFLLLQEIKTKPKFKDQIVKINKKPR